MARQFIGNWILMSSPLHRVTSGQSNSDTSKINAHFKTLLIYVNPFSSQSTKPIPTQTNSISKRVNTKGVLHLPKTSPDSLSVLWKKRVHVECPKTPLHAAQQVWFHLGNSSTYSWDKNTTQKDKNGTEWSWDKKFKPDTGFPQEKTTQINVK